MEARAAEQAVVREALARGYLTEERLREALLLQFSLGASGHETALLPVLRRFLRPEHVPPLSELHGRLRGASLPEPEANVSIELSRRSAERAALPPEQDPEPVKRALREST